MKATLPPGAGVFWALCALLPGLGFSLTAAEWVASREPGWPQLSGPRRNGISEEKGLLQTWPQGGPRTIWSATNLGSGYSAPVLSEKALYLTGDVGEELHVFALDLQGNLLWKATNGAAWKNPYPGARASCTLSQGRVYHMNGHGRVACVDAQDGRLLWDRDTFGDFQSRSPTWGASESLLVDDARVIVTPGGRKAAMVALDKCTGETVWASPPLTPGGDADPPRTEGPSYVSPILLDVDGQRHIVGATARHFLGVNALTGERQWVFEFRTRHEVIACSPVLTGNGVYVTGPDAESGRFLRFTRSDARVGMEPAWSSTLDTCHGGIIALDGFLYGSWYRSFNGWGSVNAADGSVAGRDRELAMGSAIYADGRLYALTQTGIMALIKPAPDKLEIVSRFDFVTERRNDVWAHPVILNGRLYLRHQQTLRCFDVRAAL